MDLMFWHSLRVHAMRGAPSPFLLSPHLLPSRGQSGVCAGGRVRDPPFWRKFCSVQVFGVGTSEWRTSTQQRWRHTRVPVLRWLVVALGLGVSLLHRE